MDQRSSVEEVLEKARSDFDFLRDEVLGILLFGSFATGEAHEGSDIDICVVAPDIEDRVALYLKVLGGLRDDRYDARIFELLPLYVKMAVIERGIVVHSTSVLDLCEYFYPFRRIWGDQRHRQTLTRDEVLEIFDRGQGKRNGRDSR